MLGFGGMMFAGGGQTALWSAGVARSAYSTYFGSSVDFFTQENYQTRAGAVLPSISEDMGYGQTFVYMTYFRPPTSGDWTFSLSTDGGAFAWVGTAPHPAVFDFPGADDGHTIIDARGDGTRTVSRTLSLLAGSYYPFFVFGGKPPGGIVGGGRVTLSWSGPGVAQTSDGAGYLFVPQVPAAMAAGVYVRRYAGSWLTDEAVFDGAATDIGARAWPDPSDQGGANVSLDVRGAIHVPRAGSYSLSLTAQDRAWCWIGGNAASPTKANATLVSDAAQTVKLPAGLTPVRLRWSATETRSLALQARGAGPLQFFYNTATNGL